MLQECSPGGRRCPAALLAHQRLVGRGGEHTFTGLFGYLTHTSLVPVP